MDSSTLPAGTGRSTRRKRTYSTSARQPQHNAASQQRTGDTLETGIMLPDTPPAHTAKRSRVERPHPSPSPNAPTIEHPTAACPAHKPPADAQVEQSLELLEGFRSDLLHLRSTLTCKICTRLFFEPYTTPCGHTYCYSCLCTWFASAFGRESCPDCRALVRHAPAPAYAIRDLISIFLDRPELHPPNETRDSLQAIKEEEAEILRRDRANKDPHRGGLFRGSFAPGRQRRDAVRDFEDGVDRCPFCHWEVEGRECLHCGAFYDSDLDHDTDLDEDLDDFTDLDDMFQDEDSLDWHARANPMRYYDEFFARAVADMEAGRVPRLPRPRRRHPGYRPEVLLPQAHPLPSSTSSGTEGDDDDDENGSLSSFINDSSDLGSEHSGSTVHQEDRAPDRQHSPQRRRRRPIVDSESSGDEDEDAEFVDDMSLRHVLHRRSLHPASMSQQSAASWSSSEGDSDDEDQAGDPYDDGFHSHAAVLNGWSPFEQEDGPSDDDNFPEEPTYDDDSDGASTPEG